jgi:hypothetical protein
MEDFYRQIDGVLEPLVKGLNGRWERQDGPGH